MDMDLTADAAFAPARAAIEAGRIPGAVLGIVDGQGRRALRSAGHARLLPQPEPLDAATWFDLASLTKVIFTTTAILRLVEQGVISLDDPLVKLVPDLRQYDASAPERRLTFRQCLQHQTFLPAVEPIYSYGLDPQTMRAFILQRAWKQGPPVYSDINFLLLGIALERATGTALIGQPVPPGMSFRPDPARCAATEACTWRGRVMQGQVHDENAFAFGGAAGHAGLFAPAGAVLDFALALLRGEALKPETILEMRASRAGTRAPGWEAAHEGWHGGAACSAQTLGHTGFTGTGLWIDFERGLAWTLLTNRVHPSRHVDTGIMPLRRATGEAVVTGFDAA